MGEPSIYKDERFRRIKHDPKFQGVEEKEVTVKIDKRFRDALKSDRFKSAPKVDKYGRVLKKQNNYMATLMKDMYQLDDDEEDQSEDAAAADEPEVKDDKEPPKKKVLKKKGEKKGRVKKSSKAVEEPETSDAGEEEEQKNVRDKESEDEEEDYRPPMALDLARGDVEILSSSDDESDLEEWDQETMEKESDAWNMEKTARYVEWSSSRLAVCNLDWDNMHAEDIYVIAASFIPEGGRVWRATIYLSDFGKEQLELENKQGPNIKCDDDEDKGDFDDDDDLVDPIAFPNAEEDKFRRKLEAVRQYEIQKMRYYYAVIECDTVETAQAIYEQCDGKEFEKSCVRFDMRFIPDDMKFEEDRIKEKFTKQDMVLEKFQPKHFQHSAVGQTNARITWDENPARDQKIIRLQTMEDGEKLFEEGRDMIALSDSDSDDDPQKAENMRKLLLSGIDDEEIRKKEEPMLKVDWEDPLEQEFVFNGPNDEEGESEKDKKGRKGKKKEKSQFEQYREARRAAKEAVASKSSKEDRDVGGVSDQFLEALRDTKTGKDFTTTAADTEAVVADDRFKALFTDSAFSIEQSSQQFKASSRRLLEQQASRKRQLGDNFAQLKREAGSNTTNDLVAKLKQKTAKKSRNL